MHFPPSTRQLCNMQQLQRYLTLKIVRFPNIVFFMVTSNSMLANPTSNPPVSFLLAARLFTMLPYICEMHCPANVIMMVADALAPNRHQCIANHHRDSSSISGFNNSQHTHPTTAIKQTILKRSEARQPVVDSGFVFLHE